MTAIAEHDSEQERKRDDGVRGWIHLPIRGDAVRIDEILKGVGEFIRVIVRRRILARFHFVQDRWHRATTSFLYIYKKIGKFSHVANTILIFNLFFCLYLLYRALKQVGYSPNPTPAPNIRRSNIFASHPD